MDEIIDLNTKEKIIKSDKLLCCSGGEEGDFLFKDEL